MAGEEGTGGKPGIKDLVGLIRKSPALMITVIAGILVVGYLLIKHGPGASSSQAAPAPGTSSALVPTVSSQGSYYQPPDVYIEQPQTAAPVAAASTGITPISYYQPLATGGQTLNQTASGGTIPGNFLPILPTSTSGTIPSITYDNNQVPVTNSQTGIDTGVIRTRYSLASTTAYDTATPGGIPVRSTPGGKQTGVDAYGSQVQISGPAVQGSSNLPGTSAGSTLWYPLASGGYVSAADIQSQYRR